MKVNWICKILGVIPKKNYQALNTRLLEVSDELNDRNEQLIQAAEKYSKVRKELDAANQKILITELDKKLQEV